MIITLTTDFGTRSPFVAAMKGVILSINPEARILDLSHDVPPQDVRHAAYFLADAVPFFPPDALHVVVVDPGVGGDRDILYVPGRRHRLLAPDNGCWTLLPEAVAGVIRVREKRYFRPSVSATFHGRDIFAPVAAHLSLGLDPAELGPATTQWQRITPLTPREAAGAVEGEVVFVDHFGNLITNVPGDRVAAKPARITAGGHAVPRLVRTYADARPGELVALVSSNGMLEVAEVQGSAARRLGVGVGAPVRIEWQP